MRAYTVATVAVALRVPAKWVDNTLSHHRVPGASKAKQGIARRLTPEAVVVLAIAIILSRSLAVSAGRSISIARELFRAGGSEATYELGDAGELRLDVAAIESRVMHRLAEAVEIAPIPRRGRPPVSTRKTAI